MHYGNADCVQAILSGKRSQPCVQHLGATHNTSHHTGRHTVTIAAASGAAAMASGSSAGCQSGLSGQSASISPTSELLRRQKLRHLARRRQQLPVSSIGIASGTAAVPGWTQGHSANVSFRMTGDDTSSLTNDDSAVHDSLTSSDSNSSSGTSSSGDSDASDDRAVAGLILRDNSLANVLQQQPQPSVLPQTGMQLDTGGSSGGTHGSGGRCLSVGDSSLDRIHSVTSSMASN